MIGWMDSGEVLISPSSVSANQVFVVIKCFSMLVDSRYHVVNSAFYCGVKQGFTSFNAKLRGSHHPGYSLAVVENGPVDFDGEAGGAVEAVPGGVGRGTGVRLEGDVGPHGGRGRPWPRRGPGGTGIWNTRAR